MAKVIDIFGDNVRRYRKKKGLSQAQLADACDLHRTYISSLERHKRSISLNNIQKIADALEIEPYMLFIEEGSLTEAKMTGSTANVTIGHHLESLF